MLSHETETQGEITMQTAGTVPESLTTPAARYHHVSSRDDGEPADEGAAGENLLPPAVEGDEDADAENKQLVSNWSKGNKIICSKDPVTKNHGCMMWKILLLGALIVVLVIGAGVSQSAAIQKLFPPLADLMRFKSGPPSGKKNGLRGFLAPKQVAKEVDEKGAEDPRPTVEAAPNHLVSPEIAASKPIVDPPVASAVGDGGEAARSDHVDEALNQAQAVAFLDVEQKVGKLTEHQGQALSPGEVTCGGAGDTPSEFGSKQLEHILNRAEHEHDANRNLAILPMPLDEAIDTLMFVGFRVYCNYNPRDLDTATVDAIAKKIFADSRIERSDLNVIKYKIEKRRHLTYTGAAPRDSLKGNRKVQLAMKEEQEQGGGRGPLSD
ncbi:unnamed protein product [Amoebophrya sp. A120]|nr:unnamed protein product [Amoebophrya sp. A120]|eukprot:GSA120T00014971001.1